MQLLLKLHQVEPLHRNVDRNSHTWIPAVEQVIAVVNVGDVNVVVVVPIISPIVRPRVNHTEPIALVLEPGISAYDQKRESVDAESMVWTKVATETVLRDVVSVIATTLLPVAVVGVPVVRAMLLPSALLDALLFLCASWALIIALVLSARLPLSMI